MERLLARDLTATRFDPAAADRPLPARCRTVVVGAGLAGSSVAFHLAELAGGGPAGTGPDPEVLLLDRASVSAGTSWHAAGLVVRGRASAALTALASYGVDLYDRLGRDTGIEVGLEQPGSLTLARTPGRLDELRYLAMVCRDAGVPAELIPPGRVPELFAPAVPDGLTGALHQPQDGHVNPGLAALALAAAGHRRGVVIREGVRVLGIATSTDPGRFGRVSAVLTSLGRVECERVVLAAGLWTRDLAEACGAAVPLWPAAHVHARTQPLPELAAALPVIRDLDGYFYLRSASGALLLGAFEPDGRPLDPRTLPADFGFGELPQDLEHFAAARELAEQRVPALRGLGLQRVLTAPESFTPDAAFCLGETAEVAGLYVIAGFNSQGVIYAPGAGRALAEWIEAGAPTRDLAGTDVRRFARQQANRRYLHERTREGLGRLYAMHWPHLQPHTARNVRRTPLHHRVDAAGAVFGETVGWERANWYAPPRVVREYVYSYRRQNWFEHAAAEHRAARQAVAVFDLSSFSKAEVAGPDALALLQRVCTADLDVPVGRVVYILALTGRGGIALDGTVTRLAADRFLLVTAAAAQTETFALLHRAAAGRAAAVFDAGPGLATIALAGPASRELLQRLTPADVSGTALPWGHAAELEVGRGHALCLRIGFTGELGYELYPTADQAVDLYDAVLRAGAGLGLRAAGYHALDSLRLEKGYRHLGHDIGPADDPYQAGLGFTLATGKPGGFDGLEALRRNQDRPPERRTVFVRLDDPEPLLLGQETLLLDGAPVGRLTSAGYGHTLGAACGIGFLRADLPADGGYLPADGGYLLDCGGDLHPATVGDRPFYDPGNLRLRS
jgi:glycine cleavage system aminomethyltransferase T/glycine/D-amino acid oxidase-like deaminating enzyme